MPGQELSPTCLIYLGHRHHGLTAQNEKYWKSPIGLTTRIDSIAQYFTYSIFNNASKIIGNTKAVSWMHWLDMGDANVCPKCLENAAGGDSRYPGYYRPGWFMPWMPAHIGCRCKWELLWM